MHLKKAGVPLNIFIYLFPTGLPSYQLLPTDPLTVTHLSIEQGANQPISVKIDLSDVKLYGLSNVKVSSVK